MAEWPCHWVQVADSIRPFMEMKGDMRALTDKLKAHDWAQRSPETKEAADAALKDMELLAQLLEAMGADLKLFRWIPWVTRYAHARLLSEVLSAVMKLSCCCCDLIMVRTATNKLIWLCDKPLADAHAGLTTDATCGSEHVPCWQDSAVRQCDCAALEPIPFSKC